MREAKGPPYNYAAASTAVCAPIELTSTATQVVREVQITLTILVVVRIALSAVAPVPPLIAMVAGALLLSSIAPAAGLIIVISVPTTGSGNTSTSFAPAAVTTTTVAPAGIFAVPGKEPEARAVMAFVDLVTAVTFSNVGLVRIASSRL
jgi:hypothetical protein